VIAYRFADTEQKRARHRVTLDWQATPNFQPGIEWNPAVSELGFRATWVSQRESETRPQLHFNTSSDRIGTPKGFQQYSMTLAKTVPGTKLAPFASLTYSEFEEGFVFPFGASYSLSPQVTGMYLHDGRRGHLLATYAQESWYAQVGLVWFKRLTFTLGWGF
jgi:hypothetical protein